MISCNLVGVIGSEYLNSTGIPRSFMTKIPPMCLFSIFSTNKYHTLTSKICELSFVTL